MLQDLHIWTPLLGRWEYTLIKPNELLQEVQVRYKPSLTGLSYPAYNWGLNNSKLQRCSSSSNIHTHTKPIFIINPLMQLDNFGEIFSVDNWIIRLKENY